MTINLTPVGQLVKIQATGYPDRYIKVSDLSGIIVAPGGNGVVDFPIYGGIVQLPGITSIQFAGVAVTSLADFEAKFITNFPKAGASASTTASTLDIVTDGTARFALTAAQQTYLNTLITNIPDTTKILVQ